MIVTIYSLIVHSQSAFLKHINSLKIESTKYHAIMQNKHKILITKKCFFDMQVRLLKKKKI